MKKTYFLFLALVLCVSLICTSTLVFAYTNDLSLEVADQYSQTISGNVVDAEDNIFIRGIADPDEQLIITVLKPGADLTLASDSNISELIYYLTDVFADHTGSWSAPYSFSSAPTGEYPVAISSENPERTASKNLMVINRTDRMATLAAINSAASSDDIADVFIYSSGARNLIFDTSAFDRLSPSDSYIDLVFDKFYDKSSAEVVSDGNLAEYKSLFEQYSALALFNQERKVSVLDEFSGIFNLSSVSGVSPMLDYIPDTADKTACKTALTSKTYSSLQALQKEYGAAVCLKAVAKASWASFDTIINHGKIHFDGLDMTTYGLLDSKSDISTYMKGKAYTQKSSFVSGFNTEAARLYELQINPPDDPPRDYGGGGGGGGGSSIGGGAPVLPPPVYDASFNDLVSVPWAVEAIEYLQQKGIVSGTAPNIFEPDRNVKREEFVKMLVVLAGKYTPSATAQFADVPAGHWSSAYIASAVNAGLISGISPSEFGLENNISRQDACVILARACANLPKGTLQTAFSDVADISDYAAEAVDFAASLGIINGNDDGTFRPLDSMTRAQAAKVLFVLDTIIGG